METQHIIKPQWIAKMYPGKPGRDHLGLGSVSSDQILPSLSPSINVLTFHPRYYSFYVFLLDEYWRRDLPRSWRAWVKFFRPREFIFSVGAYLCDQPEHGGLQNIVGGQKTGPLAALSLEKYDTTTDYIKTSTGGYGLYYRTVMAELGVIFPGGQGFPYPVDVPSELGKKIAGAFRNAVEGTEYYMDFFDRDETSVPIEVIREYIRDACLCQLQKQSAPDHKLILDLFLDGGASPEPRRDTFQMFLDMADQTKGSAIDQEDFRQLVHFGETSSGARFTPSDQIQSIHKRWRLYQTREFYSLALNALWVHLCDWGVLQGGAVQPISMISIYQHIAEALDFSKLAKHFNIDPPALKPESDFRQLQQWLNAFVGSTDQFDEKCGLDSPINEHILYQGAMDERTRPEIMVAGMITMLAILFQRFNHSEIWQQPEWAVSKMGMDGRLSFHGFIQTLNRMLARGPLSIFEVARWLINDYVILQHQIVAMRKLPDNTFRFRRQGDYLQFFDLSNGLSFMDSRFDSISTTIHELGLCGSLSEPEHSLTMAGKELLEQGI